MTDEIREGSDSGSDCALLKCESICDRVVEGGLPVFQD